LIVLVSKRLNPKELWLGLDSVFETSRVGLEALADGDVAGDEDEDCVDQDEDDEEATPIGIVQDIPEHISLYLSRALLAVQIGELLRLLSHLYALDWRWQWFITYTRNADKTRLEFAVLPRIHVKKPEKYLKPILDALTGCLTAIQSPELRSQIVEPDLINPTLLLVNFAKAIRDAWTWAVTKQSEHDNTLQLVCLIHFSVVHRLMLNALHKGLEPALPTRSPKHAASMSRSCTYLQPSD
jgi:hypothetical protein